MNLSKSVIDKFHQMFFDADIQQEAKWMGRMTVKTPMDAWVMQEIIWDTKPDLIVEIGIYRGGSTQYYAHLLDLIGHGEVLGVDIVYDKDLDYPNHPRVEFLLGASSIDPVVVEQVGKRAHGKRTMVILDSDHSCDHVLQELRLYHRFVSPGCYLVVEDTNVNGHPAMKQHGPGPMEALKSWQPSKHGFEVDKSREKFLVTFHPSGFLKRVKPQ